ncbi:ParB N-terminal domain-containing protein [Frankia sp. R82]|uniref:ParB/RepB/Spo0J family partition protein n=1 Tax=Frankia sp. R82 TaxID=2950553 RepID=UPI002044BB08|nr:ParB N-terminal domain-containing protein [Frankia sp. R82]MCM3884618.1 ParB N-terminal domain-containing protein [Frankia sp. R82]
MTSSDTTHTDPTCLAHPEGQESPPANQANSASVEEPEGLADQPSVANAGAPERPASPTRVEMIDPRTLLLDRNLRSTKAVDRDLVASIKQHGVLVPLTAVRAEDGLRVRHGHRRTQAAITAGLRQIPVVVIGADSDADTEQITRILTQWAENEHRAGLAPTDKIGAVEQLTAFGLTPTAIARRTRTTRGQVDAALRVARSAAARGGLDQHQLNLAQAATLAEFDDDPDAVRHLLTAAAAGQGTFDHTAQLLRDARDDQTARDHTAEELRHTGITVIDPPEPGGPTRTLAMLAQDGTPLNPDDHRTCPGHAAYLTRTFAPPNPDDTYERYRPTFVCTDPTAHGHTDRFPLADTRRSTARSGPQPTVAPTRNDRAAVADTSRQWRAATTVRRTWLRDFLTRRTPPEGADRFIAARLAAADADLTRALTRHHPLVGSLLGTDDNPLDAVQLAAHLHDAPAPRTRVVLLALILAAYEDTYATTQSWRSPTTQARRYLTALQTWGYHPADVEHRTITGTATTQGPTSTAAQPNPTASNPTSGNEAGAHETPQDSDDVTTPTATSDAPPTAAA